MNYRHHFHAGNFADVLKHAVLLRLVAGMQRKEKGFLYLDTHAGRGRYDLAEAARGDTLERKPEWPEGVGRLWEKEGLSAGLVAYREAIRSFNEKAGGGELRVYPGSPRLVHASLRVQDRMMLCEKQPEEAAILKAEFERERGVWVQRLDGYTGMRAALPPKERRALVLMDPPFEEQGEFASILAALGEGWQRMPGATYAVWYPLTERARVDAFAAGLKALGPPPCCLVELSVAGVEAGLKMRGCGVAVINPPWGLTQELGEMVRELAGLLAQGAGASGGLHWVVPE